MKSNRIYIILFILLTTVSCRTVVDWELPDAEPRLVVEGNITTNFEPWLITLTTTQEYFADDAPPVVDDAQVVISDDAGNSDTLVGIGNGEYRTWNARKCVPGRTYTLTINANGETYKASEYCREQLPIDTLFYFYLPERNGFIEPGYYVFELANEIEIKGDYYWWKVYKNDTLQDQFGYILDSDEFANFSFFNQNYNSGDLGNIDPKNPPRPFPFKFDKGDVVIVQQYCINKPLYDFLIEVQAQQSKVGSPFDAPPANPISNISNGALGYFGVLNVSFGSVLIQ